MLDEEGNLIPLSEAQYNYYRDYYGMEFGEPLNGGRHYVYVMFT